MCDYCGSIEIKVILQENGIIRLPDGRLIARLCCEDRGFDYKKISSLEKETRIKEETSMKKPEKKDFSEIKGQSDEFIAGKIVGYNKAYNDWENFLPGKEEIHEKFISVAEVITKNADGDCWSITKKDWNELVEVFSKRIGKE
jgi:hypothetical protein